MCAVGNATCPIYLNVSGIHAKDICSTWMGIVLMLGMEMLATACRAQLVMKVSPESVSFGIEGAMSRNDVFWMVLKQQASDGRPTHHLPPSRAACTASAPLERNSVRNITSSTAYA
jgi:hypothetical protein